MSHRGAQLNTHPAIQLQFIPLTLKELVLDCGLSQADLAVATKTSRPTINLCLNRGYIPPTVVDFTTNIEALVRATPLAMAWLEESGRTMADLWTPLGKTLRGRHHALLAQKITAGVHKSKALVPGNPECIEFKEVEMLTQDTKKKFKLFRDPFPANGGVEKESDIYMSDEHRYIEMAMMDTARHSGLLAVIAEVGGGKSIIRKKVAEELRKEGNMLIVYPQIMDKDRITSGVLCDAIIMDISDQKPKVKHEHKARQTRELLLARSRNGDRCVLFIEEAHNLHASALKMIKQLWELEDGYKKLISVILVGQPELSNKLDESHHPEIRELIRRIQIAHIDGLGENLRAYLQLKFKRIGSSLESIFTDEAVESLTRRLTVKGERGKSISYAYPLTVNILAVRAMNLACELGEDLVTAEVMEAI